MLSARSPLCLLFACLLAPITVHAEPLSSDPAGPWGDFSASPPIEFNLGVQQPAGAGEPAIEPTQKIGNDLELGGNKVDFGLVEGAPGARITPQSSNLTVGVGVAPVVGAGQDDLSEAFASPNDGFSGALELKMRDGPLTPSMSLSGPVGKGADGTAGRDGEVRTMFGLGYSF